MRATLELIEAYYAACGRGDADAVRRTLQPEMTHYYLAPNIGSRPVRSADHLARKVRASARRLHATWQVDRLIEQGDRAAIEWAMTWSPEGAEGPIVTRGSEWFALRDGLIEEVRSYHEVLTEPSDLDGFPYTDRRYSDQHRPAVKAEPGAAPSRSRLPVIIGYYDACTTADAGRLAGFFTDDVTHYFLQPNVGSAPVSGAQHLARYWRKVARMLEARWVVESILEQGDEAVIEWSMFNRPVGGGERIVTRGTEWYVFDGDKIAEIRSYHRNLDQTSELDEFPYAERGFSVIGHESSRIHDAAATPHPEVSP